MFDSVSNITEVCKHLIFFELSSESGDVVSGLCDLRLKAGRVSELRVLLINTLHLLQSLAAGRTDRRVKVDRIGSQKQDQIWVYMNGFNPITLNKRR